MWWRRRENSKTRKRRRRTFVARREESVIRSLYLTHIDHVCRCPNTTLTKKMLFAKSKRPYKRDPWRNIAKLLNFPIEQAKRSTQDKRGFAALVDRVVASATPW